MELDINISDISGIESSTSDLNCKSFNSNALNHSDARAVKKLLKKGKIHSIHLNSSAGKTRLE